MKATPTLLSGVISLRYLLAGKRRNSNSFGKLLRGAFVVPVISGHRNRKRSLTYVTRKYYERHLIESQP